MATLAIRSEEAFWDFNPELGEGFCELRDGEIPCTSGFETENDDLRQENMFFRKDSG